MHDGYGKRLGMIAVLDTYDKSLTNVRTKTCHLLNLYLDLSLCHLLNLYLTIQGKLESLHVHNESCRSK